VERARVAKAKFPELKELADFNFALVPSLNAPQVAELARGTFIDRREVILAVGPPGTGKTHIASGIGLAACRQGRRVRFITVAELVMELSEAQAEHRLSRLEAQLDRLDLLICDELGFIRLDADQAQLLFILLAHRYTRGGLIITSNLEFGDWTVVFNDDARLVSALLDRLTIAAMCSSSKRKATASGRAWQPGLWLPLLEPVGGQRLWPPPAPHLEAERPLADYSAVAAVGVLS
jgi:DNA replication protein DnaC